ncbi:ATP-dependent RNA helicase [Musa troglodytarum]|uniref:ATP-dependent RNA helicase n=1 Tax=Musa troglodytarum TaxID=320322 RepID=A0A9E7L125_9LILI|nr:ATP-dependent RNA helicase [Musa troglodytarum]
MDPKFQFDEASSDEEAEVEERAAQSPGEFASYSESIVEEHAHKNTTSIDAKITKALQECVVSLSDDGDGEEAEEEESEPSDKVLSGDELGKQT